MSLSLLYSRTVFSHCVLTAWATWNLIHLPRFSLLHNKCFDEMSCSGPFHVHLFKIVFTMLRIVLSWCTSTCFFKVCEITPIYILLMIYKDGNGESTSPKWEKDCTSTRTYWIFIFKRNKVFKMCHFKGLCLYRYYNLPIRIFKLRSQ